MKKSTLFASAILLSALTGAAAPVISQASTYDGVNNGEIEINGHIGKLDNTDAAENIPEGADEWINVTLDTATAFHTTTASSHAEIESALYSVQNNSGRGVAIYLAEMAGTPIYVGSLSINPLENGTALKDTPVAASLIENGSLVESDSLSAAPWLILANHEGKLNIADDSADAFGNSAQFNYTGTTQSLPADVNEAATAENYTLTLKFAALQADGTTIGN